MATPPSSAPYPSKPDKYRTELKTVADRNNLTFKCFDESSDPGPVWWATYKLINADGSAGEYLGSSSGTSRNIAKEHAAKQALGTLNGIIAAMST
jgi:hypothetical protein